MTTEQKRIHTANQYVRDVQEMARLEQEDAAVQEYLRLKKESEKLRTEIGKELGKRPGRIGQWLFDFYSKMSFSEAVLKAHYPDITAEEYKAETWVWNGYRKA